MDNREREAIAYVTPPVHSFWVWSDGGDTCQWRDGKTICFRQELEAVFRRLTHDLLPPLGAVLLVLAASRDSWGEGGSELGIVAGLRETLSGCEPVSLEETKKRRASDPLVDAFCTLDEIARLPGELRHTTDLKAEIVALVCDPIVWRDWSITAADVLAVFEKRLHAAVESPGTFAHVEMQGASPARDSLRALDTSLASLQEGSLRLDRERLRLRVTTGLDELPQPAPVELSKAEQTLALIASLQNDSELGGMARLARNLTAAVHLPKPVAELDELPLGGVSDISNRGTLDRLLLSELAHDELTLSVRVAMNEALYLRRESPPHNPPRERYVLIDAGIRTWGVPRVFATSIALAMAATSDRRVETQVFRSTDQGLAEVDLTSRGGLEKHLAELATAAHPAEALGSLIRKIAAPELTDAVLVTTADTLADPDFQRALAELELAALHVATVDRDGTFRLLLVSRQGRKVLREARFALDELLAPRHASPLVDPARLEGLPAIFSVKPFPLLLAHQFEPTRAWSVAGQGALSVTRDRRLLHWTLPYQGGRQVSETLPEGDLLWAATEPDQHGMVHAVVGQLQRLRLHLLAIDLKESTCDTLPLETSLDKLIAVTAHRGVIFAISETQIESYSAATGARLETLEHLSTQWVHGRFFRGVLGLLPADPAWFALTIDVATPKLEPLPKHWREAAELVTLFECAGVEGPLGISSKGVIYSLDHKLEPFAAIAKQNWGLPIANVSWDLQDLVISRDGRRVALREKRLPHANNWVIADVAKRKTVHYVGNLLEALEVGVRETIRARPMRHRFQAIAPVADELWLRASTKSRWWRIALNEAGDTVVLQNCTGSPPDERVLAFEELPHEQNVGYRLGRATWKDGSSAVLDTRGMLHLKSANAAVPEATIVLAEGALGGWTSDGNHWGFGYFAPNRVTQATGPMFFADVLQQFLRGLP